MKNIPVQVVKTIIAIQIVLFLLVIFDVLFYPGILILEIVSLVGIISSVKLLLEKQLQLGLILLATSIISLIFPLLFHM